MNVLPLVSALVPTYGRHEILITALKGVLDQKYRPLEIIVYDQSKCNPTEILEFIKDHTDKINYKRGPKEGLVNAYRKCVELSRGSICLFFDDDVLIEDSQLVQKHVDNYKDESIGGVCGQVLHEDRKIKKRYDTRIVRNTGWRFVTFDHSVRVENYPSLFGPNMSFRRKLYDQLGGFDQNYTGSGFRFETDFSMSIRKLGYRIVFDPEASLVHRYGSPGGAENINLFSARNSSYNWYIDFFSNSTYFILKWHKEAERFKILYDLWRQHVFNKAYILHGFSFIMKRHQALLKGVISGYRKYLRAHYSD